MTLKQYLTTYGITYQAFAEIIGATKQQVHQYATGFSAPSLETALIIFVATRGWVELESLIPVEKRKRTSPDKKLLLIKSWESEYSFVR